MGRGGKEKQKKKKKNQLPEESQHPLTDPDPKLSEVKDGSDKQSVDAGTSDPMQKKHDKLKKLKDDLEELEEKYHKIRAERLLELEAKYLALVIPLYDQRNTLVNDTVKGVPNFWVTAMENNSLLSMHISADDKMALKCLKDIRWCRLGERKGFKLDFFFGPNPCFKNVVLSKTYKIDDEKEITSLETEGTKIVWKTRVHKKDCEKSFFDLFRDSVNINTVINYISDDEEEVLIYLNERDLGIGLAVRDEIIPHAMTWFMFGSHNGKSMKTGFRSR